MLAEGFRSAQSFFRVTESKRTSQRENTTMSPTFRNHSQSSPGKEPQAAAGFLPLLPRGHGQTATAGDLSVFLATSQKLGILDGGAHSPGGNP